MTGFCPIAPSHQSPSLREVLGYSITKHAGRTREGVDTRSLIEMANDLGGGYPIQAVREALDELLDEGAVHRVVGRKGRPGWAIPPGSNNFSPTFEETLADVDSSRLDSREREAPQAASTSSGVRASFRSTSSDVRRNPEGTSSDVPHWSSLLLHSDFLGTKPESRESGKTGNRVAVRGRYITRTKRKAKPSPDSPYALAQYFVEAMGGIGMAWSHGTNQGALMAHFRQALDEGMSPEDLRRMMRVFALRPEVIRNAPMPPWKLFLSQRTALANQARRSGLQRDYGNLEYAPDTDQEMTQEDMNEARRRAFEQIESMAGPDLSQDDIRRQRQEGESKLQAWLANR